MISSEWASWASTIVLKETDTWDIDASTLSTLSPRSWISALNWLTQESMSEWRDERKDRSMSF